MQLSDYRDWRRGANEPTEEIQTQDTAPDAQSASAHKISFGEGEKE